MLMTAMPGLNTPSARKGSLDDYQLRRRLGCGAFGVVYEAVDASKMTHSNKVAIKIIPKTSLNTRTRRRRIAREVTLHSSFSSHPSILKLRSYFEDSKHVYIVTELCPNGSLYQYILGYPKGLPENQVRGVMRDIIEGVQYLHSQGVMHRDLKLSNILIDRHMRIKIADFGLTRIIEDVVSEETFTFCGTPNYISPEILAHEPYGLACDIWSLGCIFLTLLTGTLPFSGTEIKDVLDRVITGKYYIPKHISCDASRLVKAMLQRHPRDRISIFNCLEHRFFDGPVQLLPPPIKSILSHRGGMTEKGLCQGERIFPTKRYPVHEILSSLDHLNQNPLTENITPSILGHHLKHVGLKTVLDEIGIPEEGQSPHRSLETRDTAADNCMPGRTFRDRSFLRDNPDIDHQRHKSEETVRNNNEGLHCSSCDERICYGNISKRPEYGSRQQRSSQNNTKRDCACFSAKNRSKDTSLREKEAGFDEDERGDGHNWYLTPPQNRTFLENSSPGEGLRNALSNLKRRLSTDSRKIPSSDHNMRQLDRLEEEIPLLKDKRFQQSKYLDKEHIEPGVRTNLTEDRPKLLLSLLSDLNHAEKRDVAHNRLQHISPLLRTSAQESKLINSFFPATKSKPSRLDEHQNFATKYAFSTKDIPPLTQCTKHGLVKVTKAGHIELQLPSISRNTFSISADSKHITVSDNNGVVFQGGVDELPWRWTKVYRYASRFVGVCRSRVSKVGLEVDGVRGQIMLNGDFEARDMREGTLIRLSNERQTVKVFSVNDDVEILRWQGDVEDIVNDWRNTVQSSIKLYGKCLALCNLDQLDDLDDTALCVPGVGWCSIDGEKVHFLFNDGVSMKINMDNRQLVYCDTSRRKERWRLNQDQLPNYVKERLERCMIFRDD